MKILIFCPYYPPHIGGLETHADEFNKYLSQEGIDITVFTPRLPKNALEIESRYDRVKIIRFPAFEIIPNYPLPKFWRWKFWKLFFGLFKERFDFVISRTRFFNTSLLALLYAKIKKKPWIHIEHGSDFVKSGGKISVAVAKIYDKTFGKLVLKKANIVIANSEASSVFCQKLASKINCYVIYRGVETEKIISVPPNYELKEKYKDSLIITFLGRLYDGKGVSNLISTLSQIKDKNYVCFIIGDGPEKNRLERMVKKLGIENKVVFCGFKNMSEYIGIIKISDIFVNPSYTEGLPSSVIEAALCKKAIIATNVGGTTEIITDKRSGFLIDPGNINILKEKIEILAENEELRNNFGNSAFSEVLEKFDWKKNILKYLRIFE